MRGLLIRSPWIDEILSGRKTWEIRGSRTSIRGCIALIKSGSGCVVGLCNLIDVIGPLTITDLRSAKRKHQVPVTSLRELPYERTFAWVLADIQEFKSPIPYRHPAGAVIWVKINDQLHSRHRLKI